MHDIVDGLGEIWQGTVEVVCRKWGFAAGAPAFLGPIVAFGLVIWWFYH